MSAATRLDRMPLTCSRIREAIDYAKPHNPDAFLAVGGGSVIDTAKLMNLYTTFPEADFLDFVNAPLGKGLPITAKLKPLIAVPTTAGTGSETTGTAIFDLVSKKAKTGSAHRNLKPTLGICDPLNTRTMPSAVHASSGLDVLCHSLDSWTAIPYSSRYPRPTNPINRPAYQGSNPISDIFSLQALRSTVQYLPRAVHDPEDHEAQSQMLLAATQAGNDKRAAEEARKTMADAITGAEAILESIEHANNKTLKEQAASNRKTLMGEKEANEKTLADQEAGNQAILDQELENAAALLANERTSREQLQAQRERFAGILVPLAVVAAAIWIGLLFFGNARRRQSEIGILRAIGLRTGQVLTLLLGKAFYLGLLGAGLGVGAGLVLGLGVCEINWSEAQARQLIESGNLWLAAAMAPLIAMLGSLLPVMMAVQCDPATVLQEE